MDQYLPWSGSSFGGELADHTLFSCRDVFCTAGFTSNWTFCGTEGSPSSRAAAMDQYLPWSGSSFGGELADHPLPPVSLTPRPTGSSPHVGESDADGGRSGLPDLSREDDIV